MLWKTSPAGLEPLKNTWYPRTGRDCRRRLINLNSSLLVYLDELEYTEAALRAEPETAELAEPFHAAIDTWSPTFQRQRDSRRDIVRAEAVVGVRDAQIDRLTQCFGGMLLVESGQDRRSTFFRRFFPVAPSEFIRQSLRTQCERTRDVIVPELEKLDATNTLRAFIKPLSDGAKAALAALTTRSKAKGEAAMVTSDVEEWKEGVNQLRRSTYAELMKIAAEQRYPRDWPEMFFRTAADSSAEDDVVAPVVAPPA